MRNRELFPPLHAYFSRSYKQANWQKTYRRKLWGTRSWRWASRTSSCWPSLSGLRSPWWWGPSASQASPRRQTGRLKTIEKVRERDKSKDRLDIIATSPWSTERDDDYMYVKTTRKVVFFDELAIIMMVIPLIYVLFLYISMFIRLRSKDMWSLEWNMFVCIVRKKLSYIK